jgi:hypothetical protein
MSIGQAAFRLAFQISPIILTGGSAASIPGGMLPIVALTEAANFVTGLLSGGDAFDLDNFFAHFQPVQGGTLIDNDVATYPFANQAVAANAIIANPLRLSVQMLCPARGELGYASKLATITALQAALAAHNNAGGTYIVATPAFFYTNCLLLNLRDISGSESNQVQSRWQFEFFKPLLTLEDAQNAQNSLMSKISGGTPIDGDPTWSSLSSNVGSTASLVGSAVVPSASGSGGAAVTGLQSVAKSLGFGGSGG